MTDCSVQFLGCKISQTDAEQIAETLVGAGHRVAGAGAALHVVNTCCITADAEKKSRQRVRQLLARDPDAQVFVTGCGASLRGDGWSDISTRVVAVPGGAGPASQRIVAAADLLGGLGCKGAEPAPGSAVRRSRAFVKVQDGCSFECSYCVVPSVRGTSRSRTVEAVLTDVRRRVASGRREIVLTGINIGLYREPDARIGLPRLLELVATQPGVGRVRISSIEVNHVNRRLVATIAEHPRICRHLHVPLQSGDPGVLAQMRRHYSSDRYLRAIDAARTALPDLNLTTDVIVGYPTEDDAAFERTLALAERVGFTKIHAFPYSPRPGTATAGVDPVPRAVKVERSAALRAAADARAARHWSSLVGRDDELIVEHRSGGPGGYLRDYTPVVEVLDLRSEPGDLVRVRVEHATAHGVVVRDLDDI